MEATGRAGRLTLAALALLALWPARSEVFLGQVFYERDIHLVWHAHVEGFVRAVAEGAWPLWNPLPGFGQPMLGDPDYMVAYPLTWLNLVLPPSVYYTLFVVAHLFWTALGTQRLLRRWRLSPAAALTGAALWTLSGPLLSLVSLWHHFASACWAPWVFLAAERAFARRRPRDVGLWALASGLQILAGSADVVALTLTALAAHTAMVRVRWRRPRAHRNRRLLAVAAGALLLAVGLAAVQIGGALDVLRGSPRRDQALGSRVYWSVHPVSLADAFSPPLWTGLRLHPYLNARLFESREPFLAALYLGVATLPLAGAALLRRRRRPLALGLVVLAAALVSLGRHAPFYGLLMAVAPPLRILRYPVKAWIVLAFMWALLCAHGVDALRVARPPARRLWVPLVLYPAFIAASVLAAAAAAVRWAPGRVAEIVLSPAILAGSAAAALAPLIPRLCAAAAVAAAAVVLGLLHLRHPERRAALGAAMAALAVADLAFVLRGLVPGADPLLFARPPVVDVLRNEHARRVYAYDYYSSFRGRNILNPNGAPELRGGPPGWTEDARYALQLQLQLSPSTASRWGLATGYERDQHNLAPPALTDLVNLLPRLERSPVHQRFLRMAGVSHVVALHDDCFLDLRRVASLPSLYAQPVQVFAVPDPLPPAYVVAGVRAVDAANAAAALTDATFDPAREVVLPRDEAEAAPPLPAGAAGTAVVEARRADRVRLRARLAQRGHLVLLEGYDPAWKAEVDGRSAPLLRANVAFMAVGLEPGTHDVTLRYRPPGALAGLGISLASLAACALLLRARGGSRIQGRNTSPTRMASA